MFIPIRSPASNRVRVLMAAAVAVVLSTAAAPSLHAQILTQEEALALAFDGATMERRTAYLEDKQLATARTAAGPGVEVRTGVVSYYVAMEGSVPLGVAYFDAHRVRTLDEVLMITIRRDGTVGRVETVAFREPPEYRSPDGWLRLMAGTGGAPSDAVDDVPNIAGATLTADAVKKAVRRTLALHGVIDPFGSGPGTR